MPRTVEHIVECHQAAVALRKAGKSIWGKTIDVKSIINEDSSNESPEHISAISQRIAQLIRSKLPESYFDQDHQDPDCSDFDFFLILDSMENCTAESLIKDNANDPGFDAAETFNEWMEVIYDWADKKRIWLGS